MSRFVSLGRCESALVDYEHAGPYYVYKDDALIRQFNDYTPAEAFARDVSGCSDTDITVRIHDCANVCIWAIRPKLAAA